MILLMEKINFLVRKSEMVAREEEGIFYGAEKSIFLPSLFLVTLVEFKRVCGGHCMSWRSLFKVTDIPTLPLRGGTRTNRTGNFRPV